jgi:hypothetical protein
VLKHGTRDDDYGSLGEEAMAMRMTTLWIALWGIAASDSAAQTGPPTETWVPISRSAQSITGKVMFAPDQITFQNGKSLSLSQRGQMLFRAEKKKKTVMADLYRVTPPEDPVLQNGSRLCNGKPVAYLLVWKSERADADVGERSMDLFSGQRFESGSPDDCGRYEYNAGAR